MGLEAPVFSKLIAPESVSLLIRPQQANTFEIFLKPQLGFLIVHQSMMWLYKEVALLRHWCDYSNINRAWLSSTEVVQINHESDLMKWYHCVLIQLEWDHIQFSTQSEQIIRWRTNNQHRETQLTCVQRGELWGIACCMVQVVLGIG